MDKGKDLLFTENKSKISRNAKNKQILAALDLLKNAKEVWSNPSRPHFRCMHPYALHPSTLPTNRSPRIITTTSLLPVNLRCTVLYSQPNSEVSLAPTTVSSRRKTSRPNCSIIYLRYSGKKTLVEWSVVKRSYVLRSSLLQAKLVCERLKALPKRESTSNWTVIMNESALSRPSPR